MRLIISNPSILMALEQVDLLETLLAVPLEISVTDFLYDRELKNYSGQKLRELGLQIQILEPKMTTLATTHRQNFSTLCRDEAYTFVIAKMANLTILTINPQLVELAKAANLEHCSLSQVLNLMLDHRLVTQSSLTQRIARVFEMTRCPLIRREAEEFLSSMSS